jgi:hypothetical protein
LCFGVLVALLGACALLDGVIALMLRSAPQRRRPALLHLLEGLVILSLGVRALR